MIQSKIRRKKVQENMKNRYRRISDLTPSRIDLNRFNKEKHTYLENWDLELMEHTINSVFIKLNKKEMDTLIKICIGEIHFDESNIPEDLRYVYSLIDNQIRKFKEGVFVRLGSRRSYLQFKVNVDKDIYESGSVQCKNAFDVFNTITENIGIFEELCLLERLNYDAFIVLREWIPFEKHLEFRGFVKDGELRGLSQYFYSECFLDLQDDDYMEYVSYKIREKFEDVKKHVILDDVVIDFVIYKDDVYILELNSFSKVWTDPCLFNWSVDLFEDFEVRVVGVKDE